MSNIEKLLVEYVERFDDHFPVMTLNPSDEELEELLTDCLKTGKKFEFDEEMKEMMKNPSIRF